MLDARPDARLVLVDENPDMLDVARELLPADERRSASSIADLADPLPAGPFDLVVSALAIHHLDGAAEAARCSRAVHDRLRRGGRFALADVVVPDDPADAVTPLTPGYDKPDRAADLLDVAAQPRASAPSIVWSRRDLAVFVADK